MLSFPYFFHILIYQENLLAHQPFKKIYIQHLILFLKPSEAHLKAH